MRFLLLCSISGLLFCSGCREIEESVKENAYVGANHCVRCHSAETAQWKISAHAAVFDSFNMKALSSEGISPARFVTGFKEKTGYSLKVHRPYLENVQCEVCHGPGKLHILRPDTNNILRRILPERCFECHAPPFKENFEEKWKAISHSRQPFWTSNPLKPVTLASDSLLFFDLFVMSYCPYGIEAENQLFPMIEKYREKIRFRLFFIAHFNEKLSSGGPAASKEVRPLPEKARADVCEDQSGGGKSGSGVFRSLHGEEEIEEDLRQFLIQEYYPEKLIDYVLCRNQNIHDDWRSCARALSLPIPEIERHAANPEIQAGFRKNIVYTESLGVRASPTLFINQQEYADLFNSYQIQKIICQQKDLPSCRDLPICGQDADCSRPGKVGKCLNPRERYARCEFSDPIPFEYFVINDRECLTCNTGNVIAAIQERFAWAQIRNTDYHTPWAKQVIEELDLKVYPTFIFNKAVDQNVSFKEVRNTFEESDSFYILKREIVKSYHFLERPKISGRLDLMTTPFAAGEGATEESLYKLFKKIDPSVQFQIHFFSRKTEPTANSDRSLEQEYWSEFGENEVLSAMRGLCVQKLYPDQVLAYLHWFAESLKKEAWPPSAESLFSAWQSSALGLNLSQPKLDQCVVAQGRSLLDESILFCDSIGYFGRPSLLVNNQFKIHDYNEYIEKIVLQALFD